MLDILFDWVAHLLPEKVFWECIALLLLIVATLVAVAWYNGWF